jgi:deazaflavin-dependent oxidoreductase (nitroreductase family)
MAVRSSVVPHPAGRGSKPLLGLRRRPGRVALEVFRLPQLLYRHGWGWLLGDTFLLLVHAGRKTGKRYSTVAMVLQYEPRTREAVICSAWDREADWIRNIRAHPALQVQIGRQSFIPEQRFLSQDESLAVLAGVPASAPAQVTSDRIGSGLGRPRLGCCRPRVRQHPAIRLPAPYRLRPPAHGRRGP